MEDGRALQAQDGDECAVAEVVTVRIKARE